MGHTWDPARFTLGTLGHVSSNWESSWDPFYAAILLNQPLENPELALSLSYNGRQNCSQLMWSRLKSTARYTIFADGGANRFRDMEIGGDDRFDIVSRASTLSTSILIA